MTTKQKEKILELLDELANNCGDSRGQDGNYLDGAVLKIIGLVDKVETND